MADPVVEIRGGVEITTTPGGGRDLLDPLIGDYFTSGTGDLVAAVALSSDGQKMIAKPWEGHLVTYEQDSGAWSEIASATIFWGDITGDYPGRVSMSGDGLVLAIADQNRNSSDGLVDVYDWNAGTEEWDLRTTLNGSSGENFGFAVALNYDGSVLYVTAFNSGSEIVRRYTWGGASFALAGDTITAADLDAGDEDVGWFLATSGDGSRVALTYWDDSLVCYNLGIFEWGGASFSDMLASSWVTTFGLDGFSESNGEIAGVAFLSDDTAGDVLYVQERSLLNDDAKLVIYDWVDPDWVLREVAAEPPDYEDYAGGTDWRGLGITADESLYVMLEFRADLGGIFGEDTVTTYGTGDGSPPCMRKVAIRSEPVIIGTYCLDEVTPPGYDAPLPPNIPLPPGSDNQPNPNCIDRGWYQIWLESVPRITAGEEYEQWLRENLWIVEFDGGICA